MAIIPRDMTEGRAGLVSLFNQSFDDSFVNVFLPFNFQFLGVNYGSRADGVFVGSNSYITFGNGSSTFSSLGANNPPYPAIHIGSSDNSFQRVLVGGTSDKYRVRFEGTASSSGVVDSPNIVWEAIFYSNNSLLIAVAQHGRVGSSLLVSNGVNELLSLPLSTSTGYFFNSSLLIPNRPVSTGGNEFTFFSFFSLTISFAYLSSRNDHSHGYLFLFVFLSTTHVNTNFLPRHNSHSS
jgi:hypothetical protein